jgi:hypothetical protein
MLSGAGLSRRRVARAQRQQLHGIVDARRDRKPDQHGSRRYAFGIEKVTGGAGGDTATYATASAGVTANMTTPAQNTGDAAGDTRNAIENLLGSAFADTPRGDAHANTVEGGFGNDPAGSAFWGP